MRPRLFVGRRGEGNGRRGRGNKLPWPGNSGRACAHGLTNGRGLVMIGCSPSVQWRQTVWRRGRQTGGWRPKRLVEYSGGRKLLSRINVHRVRGMHNRVRTAAYV